MWHHRAERPSQEAKLSLQFVAEKRDIVWRVFFLRKKGEKQKKLLLRVEAQRNGNFFSSSFPPRHCQQMAKKETYFLSQSPGFACFISALSCKLCGWRKGEWRKWDEKSKKNYSYQMSSGILSFNCNSSPNGSAIKEGQHRVAAQLEMGLAWECRGFFLPLSGKQNEHQFGKLIFSFINIQTTTEPIKNGKGF